MFSTVANRLVHCADALDWLNSRTVFQGASFITSLPDFSEFPALSLTEWETWFEKAASLVLSCCPDDGVSIFYQTDIKKDGRWIDKGALCQRAAAALGHSLLWHKIVCRGQPGRVTFGRPSFSHMLCFSKSLRADIGRSTADVLPEAGEVTWARGMGIEACRVACKFVLQHTTSRTVVDPFCGHGAVLAVANEMGLDAVGVELLHKRARKARSLTVSGILKQDPGASMGIGSGPI